METLLVFTNAPDLASAEAIANALVNRRLAACVNIQAACVSIYRWQEKIERTSEIPLLIKTTSDRFAALERAIIALHPYELPEIVAVPLSVGLPAYFDWIKQECQN